MGSKSSYMQQQQQQQPPGGQLQEDHRESSELSCSPRKSTNRSQRCRNSLKLLLFGKDSRRSAPCGDQQVPGHNPAGVSVEAAESIAKDTSSCSSGQGNESGNGTPSDSHPAEHILSGPTEDAFESATVQLLDVLQGKKSVISTVMKLVSKGADVNAADCTDGNTPLILAVQLGNVKLVKFLLKCGANLNATNASSGTALYYAIISGQCVVAAMLVHAGSDVNYCTQTTKRSEGRHTSCSSPLAAAIHSKCDLCFQLLLDAGADVNVGDEESRTPLMHALAENPWSKMSYPTPGDLWSFKTRACGQLPRSFASLETGSTILHQDRVQFAWTLLERGADGGLMNVWERILWCMWCQSPFDHAALELCIRALPLASLGERQANTPGAGGLFSSLLYHGMAKHMYLLYLSGFTPSVPKDRLLFDPAFTTWLVKAGSTPRTLQNACVVTIRRSMAGRGNVIHKTQQLNLPESLKKMITLDLASPEKA